MCNIPVSPQESINAPVDELVLTKSCLTFDLQGQTLAAKERLPSVATAWLDVNLWEFRHWSVGCSGVRHSTQRFADSLISTQLQQIIIRSAFPVYEWPMRLCEYAKTKTSMVGQHAAFHQNPPQHKLQWLLPSQCMDSRSIHDRTGKEISLGHIVATLANPLLNTLLILHTLATFIKKRKLTQIKDPHFLDLQMCFLFEKYCNHK